MKSLLYNLIIIFSSTIIIAFITGIIYYKKLSKHLKIVFFYTLLTSILGIVSTSLSMRSINNLVYVNIQAYIEFIVLSIAFVTALNLKRNYNFFIYFIISALWLFCIISHYAINPLEYDNRTITVSSFILVTLSVTYLIYAFKHEINDNPMKIISIGAFMCFSSTLLISVLGNRSEHLTTVQLHWVYLINSVFFMFFSILIIIGFILCGKQQNISK